MDGKGLEELASLGEVSAEIAHELRNALLVISASTYLALKDPKESAPHLAKIERQTRSAQLIIDGMMALARGDTLPLEDVRLGDVLELARMTLPVGSAHFEDEVGEQRVQANPVLLSRAFRCLYANSVQASAPRIPRITTRARTEKGGLVVLVEDDGPGVPEGIHESLFEPLVTKREGGTGLGLSLARRVIGGHGGTIELLPTEKGATFRLVLKAPPPVR